MLHTFKPILTGGQTLDIDFTYEFIKLDFGTHYISIFEEKLSHVENMWGDVIPFIKEVENFSSFDYGRVDVDEQALNNFLDLSVTANIHPIELELIKDKFKEQKTFNFTWSRFTDNKIPKENKQTLRYNSNQARIAKLEVLSTQSDKTKIKLRIIMPSFNLYGILSLNEKAYYQSVWKSLSDSRFDFVIKTYLIYILLHRGQNITDRELISVQQFFINLGLFKKVYHINKEREILINLVDEYKTYTFKYPEP